MNLAHLLDESAETTLDGAIGPTDTSLVVASSFALTPPFRIWIGSEMIVVMNRSGNTYSSLKRAQDHTTAESHADGDKVLFPIIPAAGNTPWAGGLFEILTRFAGSGGGGNTSASYITAGDESAPLPHSRQIVQGSGITITDNGAGSTIEVAAVGSGGGRGSLLSTPPALGTWGTVNGSGITTDNDSQSIFLLSAVSGGGGPTIQALTQALPGSTFDFRTTFMHLMPPSNAAATLACGIGLRESGSGKLIVFEIVNNSGLRIQINRYNSPTSHNFGSFDSVRAEWIFNVPWGFRIRQSGGTRYFEISNDLGGHWMPIFSEGDTDFISPDEALIFVDANVNGAQVGLTLTGMDLT